MRSVDHRSERKKAAGFTLVELLLTVSLVLMLVSAMVFNFSSLLNNNRLEEGTVRLETLMRYARAQAANSGRKVQIVFNSEPTNAPAAATGEVRATWEPDPLGQPGCFANLDQTQWNVRDINDLIQVESVKLLDSPAAQTPATRSDDGFDGEGAITGNAATIAPITFYPDGSSDSAEIIIAAKSPDEDQRMAVRLMGINGSISHQLLMPDDDEVMGESGSSISPTPLRHESLNGETFDQQAPPRLLNPRRNAISVPQSVQNPTPRTTVGETNSVDRAE